MNQAAIRTALKTCPEVDTPKIGCHRGFLERNRGERGVFLCIVCAQRLCKGGHTSLLNGGTSDYPTGLSCIGCGKVDA